MAGQQRAPKPKPTSRNNLRELRTVEGIKRSNLARESGLSDKTIMRVETGEQSTPVTLHGILNALNSLRRKRGREYSFKEVFPDAANKDTW